MTASAFSSSAALTRPPYGSPRNVWNSQRMSNISFTRSVSWRIWATRFSAISSVVSATGAPMAAPAARTGCTYTRARSAP